MINLKNVSQSNLHKAIQAEIKINSQMKKDNERFFEIIKEAKEIAKKTNIPLDFVKVVLFEVDRRK